MGLTLTCGLSDPDSEAMAVAEAVAESLALIASDAVPELPSDTEVLADGDTVVVVEVVGGLLSVSEGDSDGVGVGVADTTSLADTLPVPVTAGDALPLGDSLEVRLLVREGEGLGDSVGDVVEDRLVDWLGEGVRDTVGVRDVLVLGLGLADSHKAAATPLVVPGGHVVQDEAPGSLYVPGPHGTEYGERAWAVQV